MDLIAGQVCQIKYWAIPISQHWAHILGQVDAGFDISLGHTTGQHSRELLICQLCCLISRLGGPQTLGQNNTILAIVTAWQVRCTGGSGSFASCAFILAVQVIQGALTIGSLNAFVIYSMYVGANVGSLASVVSSLIQACPPSLPYDACYSYACFILSTARQRKAL